LKWFLISDGMSGL